MPEKLILQGKEYNKDRVIAKTGHSTVYEGTDAETGEKVCIKEIKKGSKFLSAAKKGAAIQASLSHTNIAAVYGYGDTQKGSFAIVMELVKGQSLEDIITSKSVFPEPEAIQVGLEMGRALTYLHSLPDPVVYRDMKPANIIKRESGGYCLIDFEIARRHIKDRRKDTINLGTRGYAAPEQQANAQTDGRADIFGLGMTLHALLTGKRPDEPPFEMHSVQSYRPSVSPSLSIAITKATRLDPEKRYQTAEEFSEKLMRTKEDDDTINLAKKRTKIRGRIFFFLIVILLLFIGAMVFSVYIEDMRSRGITITVSEKNI